MSLWRPLALSFLVTAVVSGCDDGPDLDLPAETTTVEASVMAREAAVSVSAECDQAPDGTPCGDGGATSHCLYNACVLNVCGDGVKAGDEVCDDGDQEDSDGCNSRCQEPMCGNGLSDGRDQCDDGNTDNNDGCDTMCRITEIATRPRIDAGVAADAGTDASLDAGAAPAPSEMDTGTGAMDTGTSILDTGAGALDTSVALPDTGPVALDAGMVDAAACQACVRATTSPCRDWFGGGDMVAGCFNNADPKIVEHCVALYRCALRATDRCIANVAGLAKCFCGEADIDGRECYTNPATPPKGQCISEVYAATGCTAPSCVEMHLVDENTAGYYAQYLSICTVNSAGCQADCPIPQTTPF